MTAAEHAPSDIDFLIEQFGALTDSRKYERISDFVERNRTMPRDLTKFPGKFSYGRWPYFVKLVNILGPDDPTEEFVLMKGTQLGGTTGLVEAFLFYAMFSNSPSPVLFTTVNDKMAKKAVAKIDRMIDGAGMRGRIRSQVKKNRRSSQTGDTGMRKEYKGGYLDIASARSDSNFRQEAYPRAVCDEADTYPLEIGKAGNIYDLIRSRLDSYSGNKKLFITGNPLVEQTSLVFARYKKGNQLKYFVPCKFCGTMQELVWHGVDDNGYKYGIVWENTENFHPDLKTVGYKCCNPECGKVMKNYDKETIMSRGEWRATAEPENPYIQSAHISPLYNPPGMMSWEDAVLKWEECWDFEHNRLKDKEKYRVFRNQVQGLPFFDQGEQVRYEKAVIHRRGYAQGTIPNALIQKDTGSPLLVVIASVDVQKECLYVDIKGYAADGATWTLDFLKFDGATEDFSGPWDKLSEIVEYKIYIADNGKKYPIAFVLVDSGHYTQWVYAWCGKYPGTVAPCKGVDYIKGGETYRIFDKKTLENINLPVAYHIHTTKLKDRIARSLNNLEWNTGEHQPAWYPNFPEDFRDDYFHQFGAENKMDQYDKVTRRYIRTVWVARHGIPNHAFDTYVYNLAALEIYAENVCRNDLGLHGLEWGTFWEYAKRADVWFGGKEG